MKKLFSILVLAVAAMASYSASAQSLMGQWISDKEDLDDGFTGRMGVQFNGDNTGVVAMFVLGEMYEDGINMRVEVYFGVAFDWTRSGDDITFATSADAYVVEVEDISITSGDPEVDKLLKSYEGEFAKMLLGELEPELKKELLDTVFNWTIRKLTSHSLIVEESTGDVYYFSRLED